MSATAAARASFVSDASLDVVRYSQVWEDHRVLDRALNVGHGDDVLSIGSAGCNVLALLLAEPRSIVAIDASPAQAALIELKLAALRRLSHAEFACLLGARAHADRGALYARVRGTLRPHACAFWDGHVHDLHRGLLRAGMLERYFEEFRRRHIAPHIPADAIERLLAIDDCEEQAALYERYIETPAFEAAVRATFNPAAMAGRARDASQFRYADTVDAPGMFLDRLRHVCTALPTRGNFYLEWFFTGRYRNLAAGPPYLRPERFHRLRELAARVTVVTDDLASFLERDETARFSAANLSDVFEYLSEDASADLFELVASRLRPGGRIAYWNLLVPRSRPERAGQHLTPQRAEARALWESDRVFFYRDFHIDEKEPDGS